MRTLHYTLLGLLQVRHAYFADGWARQMHFEPDAASQLWLRDFDLLVRRNGHSLALHADQERLPALWQALRDAARRQAAPVSLTFSLGCGDPEFPLYSAQQGAIQMALPLLEHADLDEASWRAGLGRSVELLLEARRTLWKYLLLGDWTDHQLQLFDPTGQLSFASEPAETLDDGRLAQVFRSTEPLPLSETAQPRLQLRDATSQPPRVLMSRLPGAAPRGLQHQLLQGRSAAVSEIFVSR